jgi:hypothetical protein
MWRALIGFQPGFAALDIGAVAGPQFSSQNRNHFRQSAIYKGDRE